MRKETDWSLGLARLGKTMLFLIKGASNKNGLLWALPPSAVYNLGDLGFSESLASSTEYGILQMLEEALME